jgi:hypothetical protein
LERREEPTAEAWNSQSLVGMAGDAVRVEKGAGAGGDMPMCPRGLSMVRN